MSTLSRALFLAILVMLIGGGLVFGIATRRVNRMHDVAPPPITRATAPDEIARGGRLFRTLCLDCHAGAAPAPTADGAAPPRAAAGARVANAPSFLGELWAPNITGDRDLLAGNALMFSSRFLLMAFGAALGGWTAATVGYKAAFVVNAISFAASAYSVWLIPDSDTRSVRTAVETPTEKRATYWSDIREGWSYILSHGPVAAILAINILWATGGGSVNLISDRLGGIVFAGDHGMSGDAAVAILYFTAGVGLFLGMMIARRLGAYLESAGRTIGFIGWALIIQGIIFAFIGVMPSLWLACLLLLVSRTLLAAEFAIQETLLMRLVPDNLRGRVGTTDRASELLIWSFSTAVSGWSLRSITPRTLTIIAGLLSATSGVLWLGLFALRLVRLPKGSVQSPTSNVQGPTPSVQGPTPSVQGQGSDV